MFIHHSPSNSQIKSGDRRYFIWTYGLFKLNNIICSNLSISCFFLILLAAWILIHIITHPLRQQPLSWLSLTTLLIVLIIIINWFLLLLIRFFFVYLPSKHLLYSLKKKCSAERGSSTWNGFSFPFQDIQRKQDNVSCWALKYDTVTNLSSLFL